MIYIDNGVLYHMSKYIKKFFIEIEFLHMIWPAQSLDLKPIKNFCHIVKI